MASPDPVRTLIEEARRLPWNPARLVPRLADALEASEARGARLSEGIDAVLRENVPWIDSHLDADVAEAYRGQHLAQDWARVAKVVEEAGEAIDALIGVTGQNPRKDVYGTLDDLLGELADVALCGIYAIQHFTKDVETTLAVVRDKAVYHRRRVDPRSLLASCDKDTTDG